MSERGVGGRGAQTWKAGYVNPGVAPHPVVSPRCRPTHAVFARQVHLEAFVARAFVRPQHVLTHAILADVGVKGALVNI